MQQVDFFFSPASRYSYLAASQIASLEREFDCVVNWRPVHGGDIRVLRGRDPFAGTPLSGQYEPSYRQADASAWAGLYGIPFAEPRAGDFDFRLIAPCSGRQLAPRPRPRVLVGVGVGHLGEKQVADR